MEKGTVLKWKFKLKKKLFKKIFIATITNDLNHQPYKDHFFKVKNVIDIWVYFNSKQKKFLSDNGIHEDKLFWNPSYIDETIFKRLNYQKRDIAKFFSIDFNKIKDKFLIGSFQRDSLGSNLSKPKWEKNPDFLIEIVKDLDKDIFVLLLAGPRRHYIINKCIEFGIPYIFVGNEEMIRRNVDDVQMNVLSSEKVNLLYNLIDLYIVTSKAEGEPRAVMEAALTKTGILSTDVGIAKDFLNAYCIGRRKDEFLKKVEELSKNENRLRDIIDKNYAKVRKLNNYEAFKKRLAEIMDYADSM